jgi:DNA-binding protein HU-beta
MTEAKTAVITPAAALARHIEWLEFALAAARSEETWRAGRLEKATKKSRDKRGQRLAEVRDEIAELSALLGGIRGLQAGTASRPAATRRRAATKSAPRKPTTRKATTTKAATAKPTSAKAAAAAPATATTAAPAKAATNPTVKRATTKRATTPRKRSTAAKPAGSTTTRRRASRPATDGPA